MALLQGLQEIQNHLETQKLQLKEQLNSPASISHLGNRIMESGPTMALAIMGT